MGDFGRARVENELEWRYEVPKLLAAYESLWQDAVAAVRGLPARPTALPPTPGPAPRPAARQASAFRPATCRGDK